MFNPVIPPHLVQSAWGTPKPRPPKPSPGMGGLMPRPTVPTVPGIWGGGKPSSQLQLARMMYIRAMLGG